MPDENRRTIRHVLNQHHLTQPSEAQAVHSSRRMPLVEIDYNSTLVYALGALYHAPSEKIPDVPPPEYSETARQSSSWATKLNVVIQVVGSRGDVQPFVALGKELTRRGHRVRLATHDTFDTFVTGSGLEFFPIGGDPAELMAYMVKNPGLIPSMKSLTAGENQRKRHMIREMLEKCWQSCLQPDPLTGEPFVADAIIANPPSFAHVHCAQALGIPVHLMFTMPWSSTTAFPHPLANLNNVDSDRRLTNYISFIVVEWMTWQGLGDVINKWRKSIDLEEIAMFDGPALADTLKIPFTYCWSPALVPKPADWTSHIDVSGFFFRDAPQFTAPPELARFLESGPPPVYIGFGSIVLDNPNEVTWTILHAVRTAGVRAIISKGWSDLAGEGDENIYWVGDCPHEWLFQHVAAVVHHGGTATTACGLRNGKPTVIVPFFGDQPFWGDLVARAGAGRNPIPHAKLTAENLAEAIRYCLSPKASAAAASLAAKMESEAGVQTAVQSFHRQLPLESITCDLIPGEPAAWLYTKAKPPLKLSKMAAEILLTNHNSAIAKHLKPYHSKPIHIRTERWDPISGGASSIVGTAVDITGSITGIVTKPMEEYKNERHRRAREFETLGTPTPSTETARSEETSMSDRASATTVQRNNPKSSSIAGKMAGASAKSMGKMCSATIKGGLVDFPLAITEGLKSVPGYHNGGVRDHGPATGFRSGMTIAGKTFAWGFIDGFGDLGMQPYRDAKKEGALGAVMGFGKGVVNMIGEHDNQDQRRRPTDRR
ncbi:Sterol 3-beta-glucosyltransferase UGT80B1 [Emericellopsis cladophorae]|uniref:Sterol 3-beta-glucosyltransferase UGT80B1 n=1 Tax=Emericellopsis cladophorae TaxID=2686198 RepID=A0A9Q0BCH0_9HYPO|nr:Sterol 3-beta-glucosyltransferase UGT80B1 [Emericellopsis cladophorae]KAI6779104.1 Sterol 3-beta-glucosyltransferase UGT80B1 [Emericellopsis cladophorae]